MYMKLYTVKFYIFLFCSIQNKQFLEKKRKASKDNTFEQMCAQAFPLKIK